MAQKQIAPTTTMTSTPIRTEISPMSYLCGWAPSIGSREVRVKKKASGIVGFQWRRRFLSNSVLKPSGSRGCSSLSGTLHQGHALVIWRQQRSGIIEVVTGGGKTVFALACVGEAKADTTLIVVPTTALLDQWWEEAANFFGLRLDDIHIISGAQRMRSGTINIAVLNTASKLASANRTTPCFLVVDECHKAASPTFRAVLDIPKIAALGLSATPERPYDEGLAEVLVPALGPVIYKYTYREALRDGVIVPFSLRNIVFELEEDDQKTYDKLTGSIARSISKLGIEAPETISLLLKRARLLNLVTNRIRLTLKIISSHRDRKIIVFHEDSHPMI
jgi:superfamily II DNA or RNA helicase